MIDVLETREEATVIINFYLALHFGMTIKERRDKENQKEVVGSCGYPKDPQNLLKEKEKV